MKTLVNTGINSMENIIKIVNYNYKNKNRVYKNHLNHCILGGVYMHGILEDFFHYDIVELVDTDKYPTSTYKSRNKWEDINEKAIDITFTYIPNGIYPCKVYGYKYPCTMYIWGDAKTTGIHRGLVIDSRDMASNHYARRCYTDKTTVL